MRQTIRIALCVVFTCAASPLIAQQRSNDVMTIVRASISAQAGQVTVQSVSLTGSAEYIAGSDDETAQFVFKGTASGSSRLDLMLSSGTVTEIRSTGSPLSGSGGWFKRDGARTAFPSHNMLTDSSWCFPLFVLQKMLANSAESVSFVGTDAGLAHFTAHQQAPPGTPSRAVPLLEGLSQMELYLDPKSLLPLKLSFNLHPDNNALIDIPIVVQFGDYRTLDGISVPSHVQKYINGTLALDMHINNASINSGTQSSDFSW